MKKSLLLGLACVTLPAFCWADSLAHCSADGRICPDGQPQRLEASTSKTSNDNTPAPVVHHYDVPKIQEFYIPLAVGNSKRAQRDLVNYWTQRANQLNGETAECQALDNDEAINQCLLRIRQTESQKTAAAQAFIQQRLLEQQRRALMWQAAAQSFANGATQYGRAMSQTNYYRPVHTNCQTFGTMTNCSSY